MAETERVDKLLWALRLYKTRSEATEACKGGKVKIGGVNAKPSHLVKVGETIDVRKGAVLISYRIKRLTEVRLGAKLVPDFAENLTPRSELDKMKAPVETVFIHRERGLGRPTKKDRRSIDEAWGGIDYNNDAIEEIPDDIAERFGLDESDLERFD